jgi:hypothetical protein
LSEDLQDLDVDGKIMLDWILQKWGGGEVVDCIHLTQDRVQWWAVVNTVMNLRIPQKAGNVLTS